MKKGALLGKLFVSTFLLSAFTFGGGYVIISLMKKKFVDELHWLDEEEMLDYTAIAQSCPGAVAVTHPFWWALGSPERRGCWWRWREPSCRRC